jgi:hypothetical protein
VCVKVKACRRRKESGNERITNWEPSTRTGGKETSRNNRLHRQVKINSSTRDFSLSDTTRFGANGFLMTSDQSDIIVMKSK